MMNNSSVIKLSENFAKRVQREAGEDPREQVRRAWSLAFGILPSEEQLQMSTEWLIVQRRALTKPIAEAASGAISGEGSASEGSAAGASSSAATASGPGSETGVGAGTLEPAAANLQSLALYCQALYSSNAFLYVD